MMRRGFRGGEEASFCSDDRIHFIPTGCVTHNLENSQTTEVLPLEGRF